MSTLSFSPTATSEALKEAFGKYTVYLVGGAFSAFVIFLLIMIFICKISQKIHDEKKESEINSIDPKGNLIPPIYYTEGLLDPLFQDDLLEK